MSRCISQTGRMRSGKEEEVGMGRKPGCRDGQTRKASSVKAKHKNRMIFIYFFLPFPFQQADELFALSLKKLRCVLCLWRYQPFKRGKQLRHGMLAMVTGVEVVDVTHTYCIYTHAKLSSTLELWRCPGAKGDEAGCQWVRKQTETLKTDCQTRRLVSSHTLLCSSLWGK